MSDTMRYFKDNEGKWRWTLFSSNGRIIDSSSQGFTTKWSARRNAKRTMKGLSQ